MSDPLHDLFRHHPAYHFGRLDLSRDRVRARSGLDEFEELERGKPIVDEFDAQWRRSSWSPPRFVGDVAAMLLILFALWGVASLFHGGSLRQSPEQVATEVATPE
jgi:hypothetical protein